MGERQWIDKGQLHHCPHHLIYPRLLGYGHTTRALIVMVRTKRRCSRGFIIRKWRLVALPANLCLLTTGTVRVFECIFGWAPAQHDERMVAGDREASIQWSSPTYRMWISPHKTDCRWMNIQNSEGKFFACNTAIWLGWFVCLHCNKALDYDPPTLVFWKTEEQQIWDGHFPQHVSSPGIFLQKTKKIKITTLWFGVTTK
jgi:hypothetical protein